MESKRHVKRGQVTTFSENYGAIGIIRGRARSHVEKAGGRVPPEERNGNVIL